jgi:hypothetical protein
LNGLQCFDLLNTASGADESISNALLASHAADADAGACTTAFKLAMECDDDEEIPGAGGNNINITQAFATATAMTLNENPTLTSEIKLKIDGKKKLRSAAISRKLFNANTAKVTASSSARLGRGFIDFSDISQWKSVTIQG